MQKLISIFKDKLDKAAILLESDIGDSYSSDWSHESPVKPKLVLRPSTTEEVSFILKTCNEHNQPIVIQGGLTGLCGGATPQEGELSLSLERLNKIESLDTQAMTITVGAGTALETIQKKALENGLMFPLDLGARGSCQIGGNIATNAGGNQVIRYGMTRALVLGLEVVLANGDVIDAMGSLIKDNSGYDLKQLFIGSEGTLGVVTRSVLRLYPETKSKSTAICAVSCFEDCVDLLNSAQASLAGSLNAFEVMWASYYDAVIEQVSHVQNPFSENHPFYVLIEACGSDPESDSLRFNNFLEQQFTSGNLIDAVLADNLKQVENMWAIRDGVGELLPILKTSCTFDVGVPITKMNKFVADAEEKLLNQFPHIKNLSFGHIGDGNLHLITDTGNKQDKEKMYEIVYEECQKLNGTISAEHGIGMLKKIYLKYSRSPTEIATMKQLKKAMDPKNILNPGRVI